VIGAFVLAFFDYRPTRVSFVGLDNFRRVFRDELMGIALRNTVDLHGRGGDLLAGQGDADRLPARPALEAAADLLQVGLLPPVGHLGRDHLADLAVDLQPTFGLLNAFVRTCSASRASPGSATPTPRSER
jgi:hypothetical protein